MTWNPSGSRKLRRSRNGVFFGVCRGIAEWRDIPVDLVRIAFVVLNVVGFIPLWVYFVLALILPPEPRAGEEFDTQAEFEEFRRFKERSGRPGPSGPSGERKFDKERDWEDRFRREGE